MLPRELPERKIDELRKQVYEKVGKMDMADPRAKNAALLFVLRAAADHALDNWSEFEHLTTQERQELGRKYLRTRMPFFKALLKDEAYRATMELFPMKKVTTEVAKDPEYRQKLLEFVHLDEFAKKNKVPSNTMNKVDFEVNRIYRKLVGLPDKLEE